MKKLYEKIENYYQFEKADSILISIFKTVLLMVSSAYLGLYIKEINATQPHYDNEHLVFSIIGIFVCMCIEYRRLKKEKKFPISILNHLNATEDLIVLKELYSRKNKIYEYIDNSIQSLNSSTCPILGEPQNDLCHQDLNSGLIGVLSDLIERPNYFLNIDETKFTVGVYLESVNDKNLDVEKLSVSEKFFIFRDDLELKHLFPETLFNMDSNEEEYFMIQTCIMESIKFNKYLCKKINVNDKKLSIVCSPVTNVCEDCPPDGVIFTIYNEEQICSPDMENVFKIFGRILSNWVSKYNDCIITAKGIKAKGHNHKEVVK